MNSVFAIFETDAANYAHIRRVLLFHPRQPSRWLDVFQADDAAFEANTPTPDDHVIAGHFETEVLRQHFGLGNLYFGTAIGHIEDRGFHPSSIVKDNFCLFKNRSPAEFPVLSWMVNCQVITRCPV